MKVRQSDRNIKGKSRKADSGNNPRSRARSAPREKEAGAGSRKTLRQRKVDGRQVAKEELDRIVETSKEVNRNERKLGALIRRFDQKKRWKSLGFKGLYSCMKEYLSEQYDRSHIYRLYKAAEVEAEMGLESGVASENMLRELRKIKDKNARRSVLDEAMKETEDRLEKVTGSMIARLANPDAPKKGRKVKEQQDHPKPSASLYAQIETAPPKSKNTALEVLTLLKSRGGKFRSWLHEVTEQASNEEIDELIEKLRADLDK